MLVSAISKNRISTLHLPEKIQGQYWLTSDINDNNVDLVSIEGIDNNWTLKSNNKWKIIGHGNKVLKTQKLEPLKVYIVKSNLKDEQIFVFTEPITKDRRSFQKYVFSKDISITIGRNRENDICYSNPSVSAVHAKLTCKNNVWEAEDLKSTNGTFVNNKRVVQTKLKFGDCVYIMGLKIILGKNFIATNNPDKKIRICNKFSKFVPQSIPKNEELDEPDIEQNFFYRSPRFKRNINKKSLVIDSPPTSPISEDTPMLLVLGTSLTMGMMSFVTLSNAAMTGNMTSIAMGASMLLGTVLFPIITKTYEKSKKFKKEKLRQRKYNEYLDSVLVKIDEIKSNQEEILRENIIPISECENRIIKQKRNLWERSYGQDDFLHVRLGVGTTKMLLDMSYSEKKFSLDDDSLKEELYMLGNYPKKLDNVPIVISLHKEYISGIIGKHKEVVDFVKSIIIQIAAMYSYDEVKLVCIFNKKDFKNFEFTKWIPHTWSDDNNFRFIATDSTECKEVSICLEKIVEQRNNSSVDQEDTLPYYVIFSLDNDLGLRTDVLKNIYSNKKNLNMSVVTCYDELKNLPKECSTVIEINGKQGKLFNKNDLTGQVKKFESDISLNIDPVMLGKTLSNIYLDNRDSDYSLPDMITFLNLFGIGKIEHLNSLSRWKDNDPTKSLAASVGVNTLGDDFVLDLHEKYHGPHGLVAGMTGSGKSEFIITYILSLAVNYHPQEVQFVLIDYKGGGMAKSFEKLPHTVGIITNLDGAAIKRSLVSIESELKRRQAIFSETSKKVNVSNIDIYKYQKLYRDGQVKEPLSHLFIISDEFAELKTQQPDFMTQLISAARIGRSLGVHLILATQKPSGVVDDQIWSNSRFRVCLKVQERADSMDMLKREDAAELTDTGRFYLQVGYNELFEMGQSAWSGAPYYPSETVLSDKNSEVQLIDNNARVLCNVVQSNKPNLGSKANKQVDEVTRYLCRLAENEEIITNKLWLEPLAPIILLMSLKDKYKISSQESVLNPLIGEYDDPSHQRQSDLHMPISKNGNAIIYGSAGSGKTTFLNAMIYSFITEHSPEDVNLYILDFSSESLRAFQNAPHVGDVVFSHEEEKITNLMKMLHEECKIRKKLFTDYGGDYNSYIQESGNKLPSIVVTIHNFAAFTETYSDKEEDISLLSRDGLRYGIYFVLTATSINGVRFRLAQNFNLHYVLQMNDQSDYSTVVGRTEGLYPAKHKGRGLVKLDSLYEFQTASLVENGTPFTYIKKYCDNLQCSTNFMAKRIPVLPKAVDKNYFLDKLDKLNSLKIPIGVSTKSMETVHYDFKSNYITMVLSSDDAYTKFIMELVSLLSLNNVLENYVIDINNDLEITEKNVNHINAVKNCESFIHDLFDLTLQRNNNYKEAICNNNDLTFDQKLFIINDYEGLLSNLSDEAKQKLKLILEKGSSKLNINVLVCSTVGAMSSFIYDDWYKTNAPVNSCIWVGDGLSEQFNIKINVASREVREMIGNKFGYIVKKGNPEKLKLITKQR